MTMSQKLPSVGDHVSDPFNALPKPVSSFARSLQKLSMSAGCIAVLSSSAFSAWI